jgi:hypothetical protein
MKLADHVDHLKNLIEGAFDKEFARLGIGKTKQLDIEKLPEEVRSKRLRFEEMLENHIGETGDYEHAREKLIDELTFTLFNRLAAVKVMEAAALFPPVLTKQPEHGDRSFGHKAWLEMNPHMRSEELEGIREYLKTAFDELGETLPLYSKAYAYALLPDAISLNEIIDAFNAVEKDSQVGSDIWQSDDVLGWMYESYNNVKKKAHKDSGDKTEYNKVSLQSQVYTPRWVVQFLVENSLGKLYLEMFPDSDIKRRYKIANAPQTLERKPKPLHEVKAIDPACGSGNFLLYAFDFFYELYVDQIDNYGADYDEKEIPKLIIENNLHGIDLDDRAVQLAQLGLFIKAKKKRRTIGELAFNVVSSDFYLPEYEAVEHIFTEGSTLDKSQQELIAEIWNDLQYAYKFGSLIRLDEKVKAKLKKLEAKQGSDTPDLFAAAEIDAHKDFAETFFINLKTAVEKYAQAQRENKRNTFLTSKTRDAITFLGLLTTEYDVATANPPYTDSGDFGSELKSFIENNYKKTHKFHTNLYATFIKRCFEFIGDAGFIAMLHPLTFMYIKSFEGVRNYILTKSNVNILSELGLGGVFSHSDVQVDVCMYVCEVGSKNKSGIYFDFKSYKNHTNKPSIFKEAFSNFISSGQDKHAYVLDNAKFKSIQSWPFIYWISDSFRDTFGKVSSIGDYFEVNEGLKTSNNIKYLRFFWEVCNRSAWNDEYRPMYKGGDFNRWHGNLWLSIALEKQRSALSKERSSSFSGEKNYNRNGIVCPNVGSKGASFRFNSGSIFSNKDLGIYLRNEGEVSLFYTLGYLNSSFVKYINEMLNPTVSITVGDINRIPFILGPEKYQKLISKLVEANIETKRDFNKTSLLELEFSKSPLESNKLNSEFRLILKEFIDETLFLAALILLSEAKIDDCVYLSLGMSDVDIEMVKIHSKIGLHTVEYPVLPNAKKDFIAEFHKRRSFHKKIALPLIKDLIEGDVSQDEQSETENDLKFLFKGNGDLEFFCRVHRVNPINVWYWFKHSNVIPQQRVHTLAMEFLADMVREILMEDEDGIIPLVPNAGEKVLLDRIEEKFREKGFSSAQYSSFDSVLGRPIHEYLNKYFFAELSDHLKLFKQLPATPFIWHLSSGSEQGFDCYIIIYKWNRDKLMRLRAVYIEEYREQSLRNKLSDLLDNNSAEAQNQKEKIFSQLKEIESFKAKIDELLAEGYNPILDDGVGKNIAPLQKKKMIPYEVLNAGQLKKYLNADW